MVLAAVKMKLYISNRQLAMLALVLTMAFWGSSFVVSKVAMQEVQPFTLALLRFVVAVVAMLPFAWRERRRKTNGASAPAPILAMMGLTGVTLHFAFYNLGLANTTITNTALIQGTIPAATVVASAWVLKEQLDWLRASGVALSMIGVAVIISMGPGAGQGQSSLSGNLLVVGSVLAWVVYTLLGKRVATGKTGLLLTTYSNIYGALFLTPFAAFELLNGAPFALSISVWVAIVYLGITCSALGFFLWNFSLSHLSAGQAGAFMNLMPVVAVAAAIAFVGEPVTTLQVLGGALVLSGVYLANQTRTLLEIRSQDDRG